MFNSDPTRQIVSAGRFSPLSLQSHCSPRSPERSRQADPASNHSGSRPPCEALGAKTQARLGEKIEATVGKLEAA
jgi:hypothetical protein